MAPFIITPCTIADGAALGRNNMSAFWEDPNWVIMFRHTRLPQIIAAASKRIPRNLLNKRATLRHEKALDPETGRLMGYARWILPESHTTLADSSPSWPETQIPAVSEEEEAEIRRVADTAVWDPKSTTDPLDEAVHKMKEEILEGKTFLKLDYLAVHPENQRKGVGTALVQSGMRKAEELGLDIFILAFKAGLEVYKRLGFRVENQIIQDDSMYGGSGKWGVYFLIYEQKTRSEI